MAGLRGETLTEVYRDGQIFVRGEYWSAYADEPIPAGETVEVVRMAQGLRLEVRRPKPAHTVVNTHPMSGSDKENIP
jgi:membrane-bound serine protease (ClpP class)